MRRKIPKTKKAFPKTRSGKAFFINQKLVYKINTLPEPVGIIIQQQQHAAAKMVSIWLL